MELARKRTDGFWRIPVSWCVVVHQRIKSTTRRSAPGTEGLNS